MVPLLLHMPVRLSERASEWGCITYFVLPTGCLLFGWMLGASGFGDPSCRFRFTDSSKGTQMTSIPILSVVLIGRRAPSRGETLGKASQFKLDPNQTLKARDTFPKPILRSSGISRRRSRSSWKGSSSRCPSLVSRSWGFVFLGVLGAVRVL